jgi:3-carboxy-cis,cis-muconate cycloisomerase
VQAHERSPGAWHAEWPTLPTLALVASGAVAAMVELAEGLSVDTARMRANLGTTHGLVMAEAVTMALAEKIGKARAHRLVETASRAALASHRALRDVLGEYHDVTAHLAPEALDRLFEPASYQGVAQALIDRLLDSLDPS